MAILSGGELTVTVRGLPPGWSERADIATHAAKLDEILRRRFTAANPIWGLKHPHLCRTLPLYERIARQEGHNPHVVHIFRDPWTAAASQQRKNGLTRAHALLLWMSYITDAERNARHLPRSWLTYHDLLARPLDQLARIEQDLRLPLAAQLPDGMAEAAGYLSTQLNRSEPLPHADLARPLRDLVTRAWEAILARNFLPAVWEGFAEETADMVGFLNEMGASRARVIPAFGDPARAGIARPAQPAGLRPPERADDGARQRLTLMRDQLGHTPSVGIAVIAPPGRAHALAETLESLRNQWQAPAAVKIIAADAVMLESGSPIACPAEPGEPTRVLCAVLQDLAAEADYVALINAGDTLTPDACLRFALTAAPAMPDMIYCDEIVPREPAGWVRHKPGWDITRLRQSAYIGDWIWYRAATLRRLGGLNPAFAGAEEYEFQLRLAEQPGVLVERLPEALFTRSAQSRRDNIAAEIFCARAAQAVTEHLARANIPATVQNRQHIGLFHHLRLAPDPGTATIMLCDHADIPVLDTWLTHLLTGAVLTGPVILTGAELSAPLTRYLTGVTEKQAALEGKVVAVLPAPGLTGAQAFAQALALATTELVAIIDVRAQPTSPHWAEALRARLADPGVAAAAARGLVPNPADARQTVVQGPLVIGANVRLGAGHGADDPGPGGWLMVDQEASALSPPALLARRAALAACAPSDLTGDAFWIDLCAQLRAAGHRLVWTPDVSFLTVPEIPDTDSAFRHGGPAARALPWADPYHHPAFSLQGDLLAGEPRLGLVRGGPSDPGSLLLSGPPQDSATILNTARALRGIGTLEASWAPEPFTQAEFGRRAPAGWVRVNPESPGPHGASYSAVFTAAPPPTAKPAIAAAAHLFATSPGLVKQVRALAAPAQPVTLWRPALSAQIWPDFTANTALNTRPRLLWIDEGIAPDWIGDLINETLGTAAWIVVERPGASYAGGVARIAPLSEERGWAQALADIAPQILIRPAGESADADQYFTLMAAAAGCHLLADDRLDLPATLAAVRLTNRLAAWQRAVHHAIKDLPGTLAHGKRARAAALALPFVEAVPPPWAAAGDPAQLRSAAE